jgi:putative membrane protein
MTKKLIIPALLGASALFAATHKPFYAIGSDGSFVVMAAQADMMIAHIGKDAQGRGANDRVKDFGKSLVQDHTTEYQELTIAAEKAKDVIPKGLDRQDIRTINALNRYSGKAFDHAFLAGQAAEHERLVRAFKQEAEHGSNPDLKAYASKALPVIEKHLHDAEDLLKQKM